MRIADQEWNEKYHLQFVLGPLEQTYQLPVGNGGLEASRAFGERPHSEELQRVFLADGKARAP